MSARCSLKRAQDFAASWAPAHTGVPSRAEFRKGRAANPEIQARNSARGPEAGTSPPVSIGEAYSALRGRRPIPAALPSRSFLLCSGARALPTAESNLPCQAAKYRERLAVCQTSFRSAQRRNLWKSEMGTKRTSCSVPSEHRGAVSLLTQLSFSQPQRAHKFSVPPIPL